MELLRSYRFWNFLVAVSYYLIPVWMLIVGAHITKDKPVNSDIRLIGILFVSFIVACGTGHLRIALTGRVELLYTILTASISLATTFFVLYNTNSINNLFDGYQLMSDKADSLTEVVTDALVIARLEDGKMIVSFVNHSAIKFAQTYGKATAQFVGSDWFLILPDMRKDWYETIELGANTNGYAANGSHDYWEKHNIYVSWRLVNIDPIRKVFAIAFRDTTPEVLYLEKIVDRNKDRYEKLLQEHNT